MYWNDNQEWMEEFQLEHTSGQWRRFIDSSKFSLKAVIFHSGNKIRPIPLASAVHDKETYENIQFLLQKYDMKNTGGMYVLTLNL